MMRIRRPASPGCCRGWVPRAGDVRAWPAAAPDAAHSGARRDAVAGAAAGGRAWRNGGHADRAAIDGLMLLSPADQQEEASAIAMVLREALETPGATAALVTPDRDLAGRVATDLLRYGVVADDSAGEALAQSPPAVFLRLLARAVAEELAPVRCSRC